MMKDGEAKAFSCGTGSGFVASGVLNITKSLAPEMISTPPADDSEDGSDSVEGFEDDIISDEGIAGTESVLSGQDEVLNGNENILSGHDDYDDLD